MQYIFIQSKVIDIFLTFKMVATAILDFQFMQIWPFRRVDGVGSVVFVLYQNVVQIFVVVTEIDTRVLDLHLMTSRELTSGFDFCSRGHLCVAMMHLTMKFGADIFIQSGVIYIFRKSKMVDQVHYLAGCHLALNTILKMNH